MFRRVCFPDIPWTTRVHSPVFDVELHSPFVYRFQLVLCSLTLGVHFSWGFCPQGASFIAKCLHHWHIVSARPFPRIPVPTSAAGCRSIKLYILNTSSNRLPRSMISYLNYGEIVYYQHLVREAAWRTCHIYVNYPSGQTPPEKLALSRLHSFGWMDEDVTLVAVCIRSTYIFKSNSVIFSHRELVLRSEVRLRALPSI